MNHLANVARHYQDTLGFTLTGSSESPEGLEAKFEDGSSLHLIARGSGRESETGALEAHVAANSWELLLEHLQRSRIVYRESSRDQVRKIEFEASSPLSRIAFVEAKSATVSATVNATVGSPPEAMGPRHRNSARSLEEVWIVVDSLLDTEDEIRKLGLGRTEEAILQPLRAKSLRLIFDAGQVIFVQRDHLEPKALEHLAPDDSRITGVSIGIRDLEGTDRLLKRSRRSRHAIARYNEKSCLILPPQSANGIFLEFVKVRD